MSNAIKIESETVKKIREMFPKPVRCNVGRGNPKAYCVLGALNKYARMFIPDLLFACHTPIDGEKLTGAKKTRYLDNLVDPFPSSTYPAELLRKMNCSLDEETSRTLASEVMICNDQGKFGEAWCKLSEALMYSPDKCA